jgi:uncharacterized alpha/beta hydrolase family protein
MRKKTINIISIFVGILIFACVIDACKFPKYGFSGASISADVKTVFVDFFTNRARVVNPMLSQIFTEKVKDKFVNEAGLSMDSKQGDLEFSGEITGYDVRPLSIQQSEQGRDFASMNRLTVTVKVVFTNNKNHEQDFNTSFSAYYDWDSTRSLSEVENDAVDVIVEQLVEDIFNKSVANW